MATTSLCSATRLSYLRLCRCVASCTFGEVDFLIAIIANWSATVVRNAARRAVSSASKFLLELKAILFASNNNSQLDKSEKYIKPPILII